MQPLPIGTFIEAPKKHFEVSPRARTRHTAIFGKSGVGKTTLMRNNILVDIQQGEGVTVLDPHGQLIDEIIEHIPTGRTRDIIYFKPGDLEFVSSINILEKVALPYRPLVVSSIVTTFKNLFPNGWGQQSEYLLTNFCFALIQQNQPKTLLDILKLITDRDYRKRIFENVDDAVLQGFYQTYDKDWTKEQRARATAPILNKVSAFATNPLLRAVIGQPKSSFNFRDAMDSKKIILCDLSKGALGEDVSSLLGSLIMTKLYLASLSRQDTPEDERVRHHSFIDEVHNFSYGVDLSSILAEARKYRLSLTVATQTLAQLRRYNPEVLHSIFGNVGTLSSFRVSGEDAKILAEEFANDITARQLETLADYEFFIRTLENKPKSPALMQSQPRRIVGYPPLSFDNPQSKERIVKQSNQRYTRQRADVDRWLNKKLSVSFKLEN